MYNLSNQNMYKLGNLEIRKPTFIYEIEHDKWRFSSLGRDGIGGERRAFASVFELELI